MESIQNFNAQAQIEMRHEYICVLIYHICLSLFSDFCYAFKPESITWKCFIFLIYLSHILLFT